jgi:YhcH/YjgK/YiaL family protein
MIYAKRTEIDKYLKKAFVDQIAPFLDSVNSDMPDGEYQINGKRIFAQVMSYATKEPYKCRIEAHNVYVDIQSTISGAEGISIFDRTKCETSHPYSSENDVEFFAPAMPIAYTDNLPGYFTLLFPWEAHRPQEWIEGYARVKKFVIKAMFEEVL